jgi:arylsulfatase A-like enzyme
MNDNARRRRPALRIRLDSPRRFVVWLALVAALAAFRAGPPSAVDCAHLDLARQLPQAAVAAETRFLDLGTPEARPHLVSGWSIDELWRGKTSFVWAMGEAATLRFTRFSPGAFTLYFRCRPIDIADAPPQEIAVLVNGTRVGLTRLEPDFQSYEMTIPAGVLRPGENRMELQFAHFRAEPPAPRGAPAKRRLAVAWDWIGFGAKAAPPMPRPAPSATPGTIALPFLTRVDFFLEVHPGSSLRWQAIRPWRTARLGPGAALEVAVDWDGAAASRPLRFEQPTFSSPANLPLTNQKTTVARVSFLAWPGKSANPDTAGLVVAAPEIVAAGCPEGGSAPAAAASRPAGAAGPNVVLYMIDTLRADHLGVYGYRRPVSPEIDAFAAQATVFAHAWSQSGWTKSSVATMLTGLPPLANGVMERMDALPDALRTLPEMLHEAGYETLGVSTNPAISAEAGFARGFDRFVQLFDPEALPFVARPAEDVNRELFRWLDARDRRRPFFAYLHAMDVHAPYLPPAEDRRRFAAQADAALCRPGPQEVAAALAARPGLTRSGLSSNFEALYDAQIAHADRQFGLLLRRLRELGLYDRTVIVLVADHGEEFLDHGNFAHGHSLYQEILHVPLVVRWPDGQYAGRRVESPAQHLDLLPTILAAAGAGSPPASPGLDLRLLAGADTPMEREVSSDLSLAGTRIASLVAGGMHLLVRERPNPAAELYDLRRDPHELRNLADAGSVRFGFLMARLRRLHRDLDGNDRNDHFDHDDHNSGGDATAKRPPISPELDAQLRALGYL